ncbi:hypothetical protein OG559_29635 [Micromonospora sp. NBC_01405]|uniref:hypothetical protein n=1 Tax=Micromonospora sp. NBC_01405 TaxID=2903589 RepID=UPI0032494FD5
MVLRRFVAVVAVGMVTACGSSTAHTTDRSAGETIPSTAQATGSAAATKPASPAVPATGGSGYSATLSARLVTTESVPPGFTVEIATAMAPDAGDQRSGVDVSCSDMIPLLSARRLTGTPSAKAAATLSYDADPDVFWVGTEVLRTYADDGARQAMTDLRTFTGRCPTVVVSSGPGIGDRYRFAVAPGPQLGDDSIHVSNSSTSGSDPMEWDSIIVRIGTALVVVQEEGNEPGDDKYLTQLAEAAVRRYQTTGS